MKKSLTIVDIRSKHNTTHPPEIQSLFKRNLWGHFVLREVSYYLAWFCLRLGVSAKMVTGSGFIIGCIGCVLLAAGSYNGIIIGASLLNLWALLDYVDGNVARCTNSCSDYGMFLDDISDSIIPAFMFTSIGIGVYLSPDPRFTSLTQSLLAMGVDRATFLVLGGWTALCGVFLHMLEYNFTMIFGWKDIVDLTTNIATKIGFNLQVPTGIVMPVLILATILGFLSIFIVLWASIGTCAFVFTIIQLIKRARVCKQTRRMIFHP